MPLPRERRTFLSEHFDTCGYVDNIDWEGTKLPVYWDVTGTAFTPSKRFLIVDGPGTLIFNEEFLHNNFSISVLMQSTDSVIFDLITRYTPLLYARARYDFSNNTITLHQEGGSVIDESADFNFVDNRLYSLTLWAHDSTVYVWVNGYNILSFTTAAVAKTFALNIVSGSMRLFQLQAKELVDPVDPSMEDEISNTLVQYRKFLQAELAEVVPDDWNKYREVHNRYRHNRNVGANDSTWEQRGYPVVKPSTDAFFNQS